MDWQVDFEPIGKRVTCEPGASLLEAAQKAGVMLTAVCGGEGTCGRCLVRVIEGDVTSRSSGEDSMLGTDADMSLRLACRTRITGNVRVDVPVDSLVAAQRIQAEGESPAISLDPAVHAVLVSMEEPTLSDLRSDAKRLRDALHRSLGGQKPAAIDIDSHVLLRLSDDLRSSNWQARAFLRDAKDRSEIVALRPLGSSPLGLAVDMGTTKLAAYLVDLGNGKTIGLSGVMNPQIVYGEDVMARINYALRHADGAGRLQSSIVEAINELANGLCARAGRNVADIADAVVVCNTAMHHLFLGLPVKQLGLAPYVAAESSSMDVKARDLGLNLACGAYVHLLPNVAGFVGADHVGMLLATGIAEHSGVVLGIDIGTNTEISLRAKGRHLACSAASGPAFEGAHIRFGMRAAPGAIERFMICDGRVFVKTVDDAPPAGLCGSGVLDAVAQLFRAGVLDTSGALKADFRVRPNDAGGEFIMVSADENNGREITLSRSDVVEVQLAKAAIRAGINILLHKAGVLESEIEEIVIAGAFGTYLDVQSGIDIGMFPNVGLHRFRQVGNAAGTGARMALLSVEQRERAEGIARQVEYVELAAEKRFKSAFTRALRLDSGRNHGSRKG